jgi:hypothetical protein
MPASMWGKYIQQKSIFQGGSLKIRFLHIKFLTLRTENQDFMIGRYFGKIFHC